MSETDLIKEKRKSAGRIMSVSFLNDLDSGVLLTGTPVFTEQTTSDLTFTNQAVNTEALTIEGVAHIAGQAAQCKVTGGPSEDIDKVYDITVACSTDSTPSEELVDHIKLRVVPD